LYSIQRNPLPLCLLHTWQLPNHSPMPKLLSINPAHQRPYQTQSILEVSHHRPATRRYYTPIMNSNKSGIAWHPTQVQRSLSPDFGAVLQIVHNVLELCDVSAEERRVLRFGGLALHQRPWCGASYPGGSMTWAFSRPVVECAGCGGGENPPGEGFLQLLRAMP